MLETLNGVDITQKPEQFPFEVKDKLIVINGVDGSGKTTLAEFLADAINESLGEGSTVHLNITNIKGDKGSERLRTMLDRKKEKLKELYEQSGGQITDEIKKMRARVLEMEDKFYTLAINRAYREYVVPLLKAGKYVILDRSETVQIAHALEELEKAKNETIPDIRKVHYREQILNWRREKIKNGYITKKILAGWRIFMEPDVEVVWQRLQERERKGKLSLYDPRSKEQVILRMTCQSDAEQEIIGLYDDEKFNLIKTKFSNIPENELSSFYKEECAKLAKKILTKNST